MDVGPKKRITIPTRWQHMDTLDKEKEENQNETIPNDGRNRETNENEVGGSNSHPTNDEPHSEPRRERLIHNRESRRDGEDNREWTTGSKPGKDVGICTTTSTTVVAMGH